MRKVLAALAVLLAAFVPAAAPATASQTNQFLVSQHRWDAFWGWDTSRHGPFPDKQLLDIGRSICAYEGQGLTVDAMMQRMISHVPAVGSPARTRFLEMRTDALTHIC